MVKKRFLSVLMTIAMVVTMLPATAWAADSTGSYKLYFVEQGESVTTSDTADEEGTFDLNGATKVSQITGSLPDESQILEALELSGDTDAYVFSPWIKEWDANKAKNIEAEDVAGLKLSSDKLPSSNVVMYRFVTTNPDAVQEDVGRSAEFIPVLVEQGETATSDDWGEAAGISVTLDETDALVEDVLDDIPDKADLLKTVGLDDANPDDYRFSGLVKPYDLNNTYKNGIASDAVDEDLTSRLNSKMAAADADVIFYIFITPKPVATFTLEVYTALGQTTPTEITVAVPDGTTYGEVKQQILTRDGLLTLLQENGIFEDLNANEISWDGSFYADGSWDSTSGFSGDKDWIDTTNNGLNLVSSEGVLEILVTSIYTTYGVTFQLTDAAGIVLASLQKTTENQRTQVTELVPDVNGADKEAIYQALVDSSYWTESVPTVDMVVFAIDETGWLGGSNDPYDLSTPAISADGDTLKATLLVTELVAVTIDDAEDYALNTIPEGTTVDALADRLEEMGDPTQEGKTFAGWMVTSLNGRTYAAPQPLATVVDVSGDAVITAITLKATWEDATTPEDPTDPEVTYVSPTYYVQYENETKSFVQTVEEGTTYTEAAPTEEAIRDAFGIAEDAVIHVDGWYGQSAWGSGNRGEEYHYAGMNDAAATAGVLFADVTAEAAAPETVTVTYNVRYNGNITPIEKQVAVDSNYESAVPTDAEILALFSIVGDASVTVNGWYGQRAWNSGNLTEENRYDLSETVVDGGILYADVTITGEQPEPPAVEKVVTYYLYLGDNRVDSVASVVSTTSNADATYADMISQDQVVAALRDAGLLNDYVDPLVTVGDWQCNEDWAANNGTAWDMSQVAVVQGGVLHAQVTIAEQAEPATYHVDYHVYVGDDYVTIPVDVLVADGKTWANAAPSVEDITTALKAAGLMTDQDTLTLGNWQNEGTWTENNGEGEAWTGLGEVIATDGWLYARATVAPTVNTVTFRVQLPEETVVLDELEIPVGETLTADQIAALETALAAQLGDSLEAGVWSIAGGANNGFQRENLGSIGADDLADGVVITASTSVKTFDILFDEAGGSEVADQTVAYNGTVTEPAAPTKADYQFKGWTLNGEAYDFTTPVTGSITLVAQWEKLPVTVEYVLHVAVDGAAEQTYTFQQEAADQTYRQMAPTEEAIVEVLTDEFGFDSNAQSYAISLWVGQTASESGNYDVEYAGMDEPAVDGGSLHAKATITATTGTAYLTLKDAVSGQEIANDTVTFTVGQTAGVFQDELKALADSNVYNMDTFEMLTNSDEVLTDKKYITAQVNAYVDVTFRFVDADGNEVATLTTENLTQGVDTFASVVPTMESIQNALNAEYAGRVVTNVSNYQLTDTNGTEDFTGRYDAFLQTEILTQTPSATVTFAPQHTVTFVNGETIYAEVTVNDGETVTKPTDPSNTVSSVFNGWYTDETLTTAFDFETRITTNTTVYAKWSVAGVPLNFVLPEGLEASMAGNANIAYEGQTIAEPTVTIKNGEAGYHLAGWYTTADFQEGTEWDFADAVSTDDYQNGLTLYAKVEVQTRFEVYGNGDYSNMTGGTGMAPNEQADWVVYGGSLPEKWTDAKDLVEASDAVEFNGWFTAEEWGKYKEDLDATEVAADFVVTEPATFYGETIAVYSVMFEKGNLPENRTPELPANTTILHGEFVNLPADVSLDGYTFLGWTVTVNGVEQKWEDLQSNQVTANGNVVYTANWSANHYTVTIDINGGEWLNTNKQTIEVVYDQPYVNLLPQASADFYKEGARLVGWQDANGNDIARGDLYTIADHSTVTAVWESYGVVVTLNPNYAGGTSETITVAYGNSLDDYETANGSQDPQRTGYIFAGWYEDAACTTPYQTDSSVTKAKMLFAKWQVAVSVQLKVEGAAEPAWTATYVVDENGTLGDEAIAEMIAALAEVQDENDTFGNWWVRSADRNFTAEDLTTVSFSAADEIIGTVTKVHVVTFYLDDAAEAPVVTYEVTQKDGQDTLTNEQLAELMALEDDKVGYVFAGWADAQGITYPYTRNLGSIHFTDNVTFTAQWKAAALNLKEATVNVTNSPVEYNGQAQQAVVEVINPYTKEALPTNAYRVSYKLDGVNQSGVPTNAGVYDVMVSPTAAGIEAGLVVSGNQNSLIIEDAFTISPKRLTKDVITVPETLPDMEASGEQLKPVFDVRDTALDQVLTEGTDYTLAYGANVEPGEGTVTIAGMGNYTDSLTLTFNIVSSKIDIGDTAQVTVEVQESATYTGSAIEPTVTVTLANATELMKDQDYTVSYGSDQAPINVGTYTVVVAGIGDYRGAVEAQFVINPVNLENASITYIPTQDVNEDGSPVEPAVEVKIGDTVVDSANYDVVYENNTTEGTATVTVTGKAPNYTGSTSTTFEIKGMRYYVYGQATYNNGSIAANQSISLTGTTVDGESVNMTTKTDRNGNFRFDDLKDGTYYVVWAGKNFPANLNAYEDDAN